MKKSLPVWYEEGLRFACAQCGRCCRGPEPGYVWVTESEIVALAAKVGLSLDAFGRAYLRRIGSRFSLVEKGNHDCIFWREGAGCSVYEARPEQCRTFPFWPELIASREGWQSVDWCKGKDSGRVYERPEIESLARGEGHTRPGL